jgi:hypothetical protein
MYRPETDVTAEVKNEAGNLVRRDVIGARTNYTLFDSLAPLTFQEGIGAGVNILDTRMFTLQLRAGVAARQSFYNGGSYFIGRRGNTIDVGQLDNHSDFGGEATVIGAVRLGNLVSWETRFDSFVSKDQVFTSGTKLLPVFRWDNTVGVRLGKYASAIYTVSVRRDELSVSDLQTAQLLALRLQYSVF